MADKEFVVQPNPVEVAPEPKNYVYPGDVRSEATIDEVSK